MSLITIKKAFISVFYKDGLEPILRELHKQGVEISSTGGTQKYIEDLGIPCVKAESITGYPSILGGRVKTLHPKIFGGILARREEESDMQEIEQHEIPLFDLVIVDLYPFQETVASTTDVDQIIEKIDIGGVSLIRAAAKNYKNVFVVSSQKQYERFGKKLIFKNGQTDHMDRSNAAKEAFAHTAEYEAAIAQYFKSSWSEITAY